MKTSEVLGVTPYVDGFEYGIDEKVFMTNLYAQVSEKFKPDVEKFYKDIQKPKSEMHHKLIIVDGYSGCGKSTFVGHLIYDLNREGNLTFKLDLAKSKSGDYYYFGESIINKYGKKTLGKLLSLIKYSISSILSRKKESGVEENLIDYISRLKKYQVFFSECGDRKLKAFAQQLKEILFNDKVNIDNIYKAFGEYIEEYIDKGLQDTDENDYLIGACKNAFSFLFLLLRCEWKNKSTEKKFFVVIDSLEHYINKDKVFDTDIDNIIRNILIPFVEQEEGLDVERFSGEPTFNDIFKIIVSCRNSTLSMVSNNKDDDDYQDFYRIDISNWFSAESIVNKRIKYFENKIEDPETIKLINSILGGDDNTLKDKLLNMHNHNMRRLFEYLCDIIWDYPNIIEDYASLTNYVKSHSTIADSIKYGRRNLIQGWLLHKIKKKNFFNRLQVLNKNGDSPLGYYLTRKVLTYLEYKNDLEPDKNDVYVGFYELINKALVNRGNITNSLYSDLQDIILALSETDKEKNHWCQLIMIKSNDEEINETVLKNKIENAKDEDKKEYAITITSAGKYFLSLMSSYEYFSVRYNYRFRPLFDLRWLNDGNVDKIIESIKITQTQAFNCISKILNHDSDFYKDSNAEINFDLMYSMKGHLRLTESNHFITHIESIIDNHISYLDAYRVFIIEYDMDAGKKEKLLNKLIEIIYS